MSNYSHVQFIPWELYTGPFTHRNGHGNIERGYAGLVTEDVPDLRWDEKSQYLDMLARVEFTKDAIKKAQQVAEPNDSVLKVFMAPEFLYRGPAGAYIHDLIWESENGQPGLFPMLRELVTDPEFKDWIFVFGTALSVAQRKDKQWEIINTALVQPGGADLAPRVPRKKLKSPIDFIQNDLVDYFIQRSDLMNDGNYNVLSDNHTVEFDPAGAVGDEEQEGGALFQFDHVSDMEGDPIKFGLEICLDHAVSSPVKMLRNPRMNKYGRIRGVTHSNRNFKGVKIQLVPSGGMNLLNQSVFLKGPNAYAFNCDGLNHRYQGLGSHSQVHKYIENANPNNGEIAYFFNGRKDENDGSEVVKVTDEVYFGENLHARDYSLWRSGFEDVCGSGFVRAIAPLPLSNND